MASKILRLFIIALSYYITFSDCNPSVLDICNYPVGGRRVSCRPVGYGLLTFNPDQNTLFKGAIYGPINIWDAGSTNAIIHKLELHTFDGIPQLVTIQIYSGGNFDVKYFRWNRGKFESISRNDSDSYRSTLTDEAKPIDNSVYLNLKRNHDGIIFKKEQRQYFGLDFDIVYPIVEYKLVGVIYDTQLVFENESIYYVVIRRESDIPKLIMVNYEGSQDLKMFLLDNIWKECNQVEAQGFIKKVIDSQRDRKPSRDPQNQLVYTSLHCSLNIPEQYTKDELKYMKLDTLSPTYPTLCVYGTGSDYKKVILDLNDIGNEFTHKDGKRDDFDVLKISPKSGYRISRIVESGTLVWENEREYGTNYVIVYKRNHLPLLLLLNVVRSGDTTLYYHRKDGKLISATKDEFNTSAHRWKNGINYDRTMSYSIYGPNNKFLFTEVHDVDDGVYNLSVDPNQEFKLVRIVNGADALYKPNDEEWIGLTITYFDSTHKILSLNLVKNNAVHVKYFKCNSYFSEMDVTSKENLYNKYKSQIHIQSDIFFDLEKYKINEYDYLKEKKCELVPLSGFHVKMVKHGDFVLWRSRTARCLSVLPIKNGTIRMIRLKIFEGSKRSEMYFRFVEQKFIELGSDEFNFLKSKIVHNISNPNHQELLNNAINMGTDLQYFDYDTKSSSPFVISYTNLDKLLVETRFASTSKVFGNITFDGKFLWIPFDDTHYMTKFSIFYYNATPVLGKFYGNYQGAPSTEYYDFSSSSPESLDESEFIVRLSDWSSQANKLVLKNEFGYKVVLDLLKYDDFRALGRRWEKLICIDYSHRDNFHMDLVLFGFEIIWSSEFNEKTEKISVVFYEKVPIIVQLKLSGGKIKYLSHLNGVWHEVDQNLLKPEMKTLFDFEPNRVRFTIPESEETTPYDESLSTSGYFTTRRFISRKNLLTSILDGRNRLYSPDLFSFVECILVYYHGTKPRLVSFREANIFGYTFDHYFAFKNGWRQVPYSIFEQFYNHFSVRPPREKYGKNSFPYDIQMNDSRVSVSPDPNKNYLYKYEIVDPINSLSFVWNGNSPVWESPKNKTLHTFYLYKENNEPLIAKFIEENLYRQQTEVYMLLSQNGWTEVDHNQFTDAVNTLDSRSQPRKRPASDDHSHSSGEASHLSHRRRSTRVVTQTSLNPPSDSVLDLNKQVDSARFKVLGDKFKNVVDLNYYEPRNPGTLKGIKLGNGYVWATNENNLSCSKLRCYFSRDDPVLFELIINDSDKNINKYKYFSFNESGENWIEIDQDLFDVLRDSIITS